MAHAVIATAYGGPEVLDVVEVDPGEPGPGEVLLEVHAAGVNPTDWKSYSGAWGTDVTQLPIHLGREASGVVIAIGEDVDTVAVGDEVIAYEARGAYTDRMIVPAGSVFAKPAAMSLSLIHISEPTRL